MTPSHVVLHLGLHKSASTYIQESWLKDYSWIRDSIWYPPPSAFGPGHASIAWWASDRQDFAGVVQTPVTAVLNEAQKKGVETVLLSSEEFDGLDAWQLAKFRGCLESIQLTVIVVAARPRARFLSAWQELLKAGRAGSQNDLFAAACRLGRLEPGWLTEAVRALAPSAVLVRLIDPQRPDPRLPESLARLGLRPETGEVPVAKVSNPGMDQVSCDLLAMLNMADPMQSRAVRRVLLTKLLQSVDWRMEMGEPLRLDEDVQSRLRSLATAELEEFEHGPAMWDLWDPEDLRPAWSSIASIDDFEAPTRIV